MDGRPTNTYTIIVEVDDRDGHTTQQTITITVTDVDDEPTQSSSNEGDTPLLESPPELDEILDDFSLAALNLQLDQADGLIGDY